MNEKFQNKKVKEAVDLLIEGGAGLSNALSKGGLELTKAIRELKDLDQKILSLYAKGMSLADIKLQ